MNWISREELERAISISLGRGVAPHPDQSLTAVPQLLESCWTAPSGPLSLGEAEAVIVLAVDGVDFASAQSSWSPDFLMPMTSVFPSTSVVAWLSATTGLSVGEHGVPGVVFYTEETGSLFNCLTDRCPDGSDSSRVTFGPWPTIFTRLNSLGAETVAIIGDLEPVPGRWRDSVLHGATLKYPTDDWDEVRWRPEEMSEVIGRDLEKTIEDRTGRPLMVWCYIHIDPFIHQNGYDPSVLGFLKRIDESARRWTEKGFTVVAHSDHGMAKANPQQRLHEKWEDINRDECRSPSGGAGRVRWVYPRDGRDDLVLERLATALGESALVCPVETLGSMGLLESSELILERVGSVVAIATGEEFPLPEGGQRYEHGSFSREEMIVPFAVWGAAR